MRVLVATDGQLDVDQVQAFAGQLAGPDGSITVFTVIEIPRQLLAELRARYGEQPTTDIEADAEYVGMGASGANPVGWPGDDAMLARYLADKEIQITGPVVEALRDAGLNATAKAVEGENAAVAILEEAAHADVVCIGSHGQGRFEGLIGSTGTKIVRHAACPVLVLRTT